jgi:hypothetical protein
MKKLENRTVDSKREMDILDALQDIRARNARNERVGQSSDLLDKIGVEDVVEDEELLQRRVEDDEDEELVRQVFSKVNLPSSSNASATQAQVTVKRKADGAEPDLHSLLPDTVQALITSKVAVPPIAKKRKTIGKTSLGIKVGKKKS